MTEPRVYIACLASYNAGKLHGEWVDPTLGVEHLEEEVARILASSPEPGAEEFAIHDYEGLGSAVGEYSSLSEVAALAELVEEHGEVALELMSHVGLEASDVSSYWEDHHCGEWKSTTAFAWEYVESCLGVPEHLERYIDIGKVERDLFCGDHFSLETAEGTVHVFSSH